jgi:SAM-dependent methyltransferase
VTRLDDPALVRREYATEAGLLGRAAAYRYATGPDPREIALAAIREAAPRRLLEVGCGPGVLAERIAHELGVDVVALDQSERMIELTRARGVEAVVGDAAALHFADASFDCVVAAWMLYHVADVRGALAEFARVLRPQGRVVAITNSVDHLRELRDVLGNAGAESSFSAENGAELLRAHFPIVERRDAFGWIEFPDRDAAQAYVDAASKFADRRRELPQDLGPLRVWRGPVVFVADKS